MYPVDLLIFDLDGTLADTKDDIATAVNLTLRDFGLPEKPPEVVYGYVGDGVRRLLQRAFEDAPPERYREALHVFRRHYLDHLLDTTRLYEGVEETLAWFGGKKKAVVTNKPIEYTRNILDGLRMSTRFDLILGGEDSLPLKPDPAMVVSAIERLAVSRDRTVMIGDSLNDIQAARSAGVKTCGVGYGLGDPEVLRAAGPDFFCDRLVDLKKWLR